MDSCISPISFCLSLALSRAGLLQHNTIQAVSLLSCISFNLAWCTSGFPPSYFYFLFAFKRFSFPWNLCLFSVPALSSFCLPCSAACVAYFVMALLQIAVYSYLPAADGMCTRPFLLGNSDHFTLYPCLITMIKKDWWPLTCLHFLSSKYSVILAVGLPVTMRGPFCLVKVNIFWRWDVYLPHILCAPGTHTYPNQYILYLIQGLFSPMFPHRILYDHDPNYVYGSVLNTLCVC